MIKAERQDKVRQLLEEQGTVSVKEISDALGVSDMTIRRDLEELASLGEIERVHGGARSAQGRPHAMLRHEYSHSEKRTKHAEEKLQIARRSVELIEAQHHIAHVAGNVGHVDAQHGGTIVHNANADLGPVEGVTMNGGTARRGAEKLGSDHLVPNIEVFPTNCSANTRDYHYTPLKQGVFFSKK